MDRLLTRLEFLWIASAGAAASAAGWGKTGTGGGPPGGRGEVRPRVPIGLQLHSVRNECAKDLPGVLAAVAAMGYQGVEFAGYHSHASDLKTIDGETVWDVFFASTRPEVVMQVDTANMLAGGGDPVQCLKKYPGRAATIHLKKYSRSNPAALLGEGDVDRRALFNVVDAQGATEWLIVEYEADSVPPLVAVGECLANLRTMVR